LNRYRYELISKKNAKLITNLSVVEQVDCLIDHSIDPNILGRTWVGWTPYV